MAPGWKRLIRGFGSSKSQAAKSFDPEQLPKHIAIIMDGNGRWARSKGLPRVAGHRAGMSAMRETIRTADDLGIKILTLYAFSTENWKRPLQEIQFLWQLVDDFFRLDIEELVERNVCVRFIGDTTQLPTHTQGVVAKSILMTEQNTGMIVQFALNYGSRAELVEAVKRIADEVRSGTMDSAMIDEGTIANALATSGLPDPDLLIRTSGDQRVSNFLLWQIAYTELYFVREMWPNFTREHLLEAISAYTQRERRFGGLK